MNTIIDGAGTNYACRPTMWGQNRTVVAGAWNSFLACISLELLGIVAWLEEPRYARYQIGKLSFFKLSLACLSRNPIAQQGQGFSAYTANLGRQYLVEKATREMSHITLLGIGNAAPSISGLDRLPKIVGVEADPLRELALQLLVSLISYVPRAGPELDLNQI